MSWFGRSTGRSRASSGCHRSGRSASRSPHATWSALAQRCDAVIAGDQPMLETARWNCPDASKTSSHIPSRWSPSSHRHATHPSTTQLPVFDRTGRMTRTASRASRSSSASASQMDCSGSPVGLRTMDPARNACPWPPASGSGSVIAQAASTECGGTSVSMRDHRATSGADETRHSCRGCARGCASKGQCSTSSRTTTSSPVAGHPRRERRRRGLELGARGKRPG